MKGYSDGKFKPNDPLTRAQAVSIIVSALNLQTDEVAPFRFIGYYANGTKAEIAAAHKYGMIKGSDGNFKPSAKITRAKIALMIQRVYEYKTGMRYTASKAPYTDFGCCNKETVNCHLDALRTRHVSNPYAISIGVLIKEDRDEYAGVYRDQLVCGRNAPRCRPQLLQ